MAAPEDVQRQPLDDAEMAAWHAMIRAHSRVVRRLEAELDAEHGLSLPAYEVLAHLSTSPERRLRMSDLAKHAILTPSGLTRLVDKLAREGLVERQRCGADARVVYAWLTPAGMTKLETAYPTHLRGVREHFLDWLSPDQQHALSNALADLSGAGPHSACTAAEVAEGEAVDAAEAAGCDKAEAAASDVLTA
jgi:DNA-binding MarR family transcriptional regulator